MRNNILKSIVCTHSNLKVSISYAKINENFLNYLLKLKLKTNAL